MDNENSIVWLENVAADNYVAAQSYLTLLFDDAHVSELIIKLRGAELSKFKSKDVFRASQLSLLGISNARVQKDRKKIEKREPLSPILLVRDQAHGKVIIADGYHRMCAIYGIDENEWIRCKII